MHPALSVIVFTTLSGAGYGLMAWVALAILADPAASTRTSTTAGLGLALLLVTAGLLSSIAHLGQPQRAWRAFSQWKTSWLSREGVMAVLTYLPVLALLSHPASGAVGVMLSLAMIVLALSTVACTAMIYASLAPIPAWRHAAVVPVYLGFALLCGGLCWATLEAPRANPGIPVLMSLAAVVAALKWRYWRDLDAAATLPSLGAAVGLPQRELGVFERPHTEANYLTREMGFVLARRHAAQLQRVALALFAAVPMLALPMAWWLVPEQTTAPFGVAAISALLGAGVERWLFFAQARHVVMQYYGTPAAPG